MKISLHIGPDLWATTRLQQVLDAKRRQLLRNGVLFARTPGARNHTRLFMAVSDPGAVDTLRHNRGFAAPERQAQLRADVTEALAREVEASGAGHLILSAHQFGSSLLTGSELERLKAVLAPISDRVEVIAHLDCPARMLLQVHDELLFEVEKGAVDELIGVAKEVMESACDPVVKLDVPLVVDAGQGANWAEAH